MTLCQACCINYSSKLSRSQICGSINIQYSAIIYHKSVCSDGIGTLTCTDSEKSSSIHIFNTRGSICFSSRTHSVKLSSGKLTVANCPQLKAPKFRQQSKRCLRCRQSTAEHFHNTPPHKQQKSKVHPLHKCPDAL